MKKMIVLTMRGEVILQDYTEFKDAGKAVGGMLETVWIGDIRLNDETITFHMLCNDDITSINAEDLINPLATMLTATPIGGNVVLLKMVDVPYEEENRLLFFEKDDDGFPEEEADAFYQIIKELTENALVKESRQLIYQKFKR